MESLSSRVVQPAIERCSTAGWHGVNLWFTARGTPAPAVPSRLCGVTEPAKPRLRRSVPLEPWTGVGLAAGARYERLRFSGLDLTRQSAAGLVFQQVEFQACRLGGSDLSQAELLEARVIDSDFSNTRWDRSLFRHVQMSGSRFGWADGAGDSGGGRLVHGV